MSEERREGTGASRADAMQQLAGLLAQLQVPQRTDIIQGVDVARLIEYVFNEKAVPGEVETEFAEAQKLLEKTEALSRLLVEPFIKDGLSRVIHPVYGAPSVDTRLQEIASLLRAAVREAWKRVIAAIERGEPSRVAEETRRALMLSRLALQALVNAYDKLNTLLYVNAPAHARPPLATLTLGYEPLFITSEAPHGERGRRKRRKS